MRYRNVIVVARERPDEPVPAKLLCCSNCGNEGFVVFAIGAAPEHHLHFQCGNCSTTFCDGACGGAGWRMA